MANSALLSDGTTSYEFVYDSASQDDFKLRYGMSVAAGEPNVLWHRPDNAPPQLVRITNDLTTIFLTTIVYGDDWDDVVNTLAPIKRWVDGDDQQAARYHSSGDVNKIYARIQLDGMTNYTDWTVIYGNVDDSKAYYTSVADRNKLAVDVVLMLTCEPVGNGASFTLRNDLASSPHFLEDSNSDGRADGWDATSTAATYSIATSTYLTGGQCQQLSIVSAVSTRGIQSSAVTASTSTQAVAYVWIRTTTGSDRVYVILRDGSNNDIQAKSFRVNDADVVSDKTAVDSAGNTWYRVVVSGTNSTAANFRLWVVRNSGDSSNGAVVYLDNAYLQTGTTTAPDGWCSTSAIENRYDPTSTSAATQARINYFDTWGIPGDVPALVDLTVDATSGTNTINLISRYSGNNVSDILYWRESDQFSSLTGTWSTGTGTSDDHYFRLASASATGRIGNSEDWQYLAKQPLRVFVLARSSSTTPTVQVKIYGASPALSGVEIASTDLKSVGAANTWELLDLGLINLIDYVDGTTNLYEVVDVASAASQTVDIDAVIFLPVRDEFIAFEIDDLSGAATSSKDYSTDGDKQKIRGFDGFLKQPLGSIWYANTKKENRYVFIMTEDDAAYTLTTAISVSLSVIPRTRHLLGTS